MTMNRNQYPCVEFDLDKLAANLAALVERCHDSLIEVAGVVKAVSSLPEIVRVYEESGVKFIATSRISQMRAIREAGICKKPLMLIRIPMLSELPDVVELCDISLQSDITVLRALNEEAKKQGKVHEVILMMDLGDLREGFWNEEDALDAALEIEHELKNLHLAGVGVNLSCYGSVLPTKRNMQGLVSLASRFSPASPAHEALPSLRTRCLSCLRCSIH
jgi:predicted amino acid racemase